MADTPVVKGFWRSIRAALHWLMHVALLPIVWLLDALGKALGWSAAWLAKIGNDVNKIGADLDAL